jgi:4-hydroxybenzoate polyprenyltransferase
MIGRRRRRDVEAASSGAGPEPVGQTVVEPPPEPATKRSGRRRRAAETAETADAVAVEETPPAPEPAPEPAHRAAPEDDEPPAPAGGFSLRNLTPLLLIRAAHPRQGLLTAAGLAVAAALSNRPTREVALVFATVLVGQTLLGWHNDLVDRARDATHRTPGKPVADGRLDPGTAWFALACGVLLVVPLSISNGVTAGVTYLLSLLVGLLGNLALRRGFLSWLPWAAAFALYPAFLSYGGWGGQDTGGPPEPLMAGLAALLGIGVHFLTALWGLVPDNEEGWTYLPLKLGLRLGAGRLLAVTTVYIVAVLVGLAFAGTYVGLRQ